MSLDVTPLRSGDATGRFCPPRYMALYDCTALAGQAVLRAFGHATSDGASVFIAGLQLGDAVVGTDLAHDLESLVRTGRRAGLMVTAALVAPPTMEAVAHAADAEGVTHVICMHPPHALHAVFTERGILLTLRD